MRVAVYTIAKNEQANTIEWAINTQEADERYVLDTGSEDTTVARLQGRGVTVYRGGPEPFRFDVARNTILGLIPKTVDVCICLDMDERLSPRWRQALERVWQPETTRLRHSYVFSREPKVSFAADRFHARHNYLWRWPCHEYLQWYGRGSEHVADAMEIEIAHDGRDLTKDRSWYMDLLKVGSYEELSNGRMLYYLGREHYYRSEWGQAAKALTSYLDHPGSGWKVERSQAYCLLSRCWGFLGDMDGRIAAARAAVAEDTKRPEAWYELAFALHDSKQWEELYATGRHGLALPADRMDYVNECAVQRPTLLDMTAIGAYWTGRLDRAIELEMEAVSLAPKDERIVNNLAFLREELGAVAVGNP